MKPSELIVILQRVVDEGHDDDTEILFDTEGRSFPYHRAKVGSAHYNDHPQVVEVLGRHISLHEDRRGQ